MRTTVAVWGNQALQLLVDEALSGTSARAVVVADAVGLAGVVDPAVVVIDSGVDDDDVAGIVRRVAAEERYRYLVVRGGRDVNIDVDWTVVRKSEVVRGVQLLVADAEAIVLELLARIGDLRQPARATRFGCVVSVSSSFVLVAIDDASDEVSVAFVLPGEGKTVVEGPAVAVPGRAGLFRISPTDETVREALLRFTIRRAESTT